MLLLLSPFIILLLHTNLLFSVQSFCLNNGNYTTNSTYANNLNTVLSSLPENIDYATGFRNASLGQAPDRANAIALCRADVQPHICSWCIQDITTALLTSCPNQRQAIEWYEFCMLRYSNETILGTTASTWPAVIAWNTHNATNQAEYMAQLSRHLDSLRGRAANGGSLKVAAGNVSANDFQIIFALVQCTPNLSAEECSRCLAEAVQYRPDGSIGGRVVMPSCNLRYESYSFYNATRLQELQSVPPVPAPEPSLVSPPPGSNNNAIRTVITVIVSVSGCMIFSVTVCIFLNKRKKQKPEESHENGEISTVESLKYSLSTVREATNDFSDDNKLGQGGFGAVYKGKLSHGQEVAVKRLSKNSGQGDQEFKNEVLLLAKLQHRNLVRLLGFCLEGMEKLLVYEFVQNASLDHFIFDENKRSSLDWEKRYKIIQGIARGILYLHEDSQLRIVHRDLKPSNVLLDGAMNPKIADFGMARLFEVDETQGNTSRIAGTFGYMAPEYARHGLFSVKSDVFSFGVLVLEIISGQKNNRFPRGENTQNLLSFAWKNWNKRTAANMVDPCLRSSSGSMSDMLRCMHIGLLCVQENAADRPTMASVVLMLNSFSFTLAVPTEPAFFIPSGYHSDTSLLQEYNSRESEYNDSSKSNIPTQSDASSRNEASITDLYPR